MIARPTRRPGTRRRSPTDRLRDLYRTLKSWDRVAYWWLTGSNERDRDRWSGYATSYVKRIMALQRRAPRDGGPMPRWTPSRVGRGDWRVVDGRHKLRRTAAGRRWARRGVIRSGLIVRVRSRDVVRSGTIWLRHRHRRRAAGVAAPDTDDARETTAQAASLEGCRRPGWAPPGRSRPRAPAPTLTTGRPMTSPGLAAPDGRRPGHPRGSARPPRAARRPARRRAHRSRGSDRSSAGRSRPTTRPSSCARTWSARSRPRADGRDRRVRDGRAGDGPAGRMHALPRTSTACQPSSRDRLDLGDPEAPGTRLQRRGQAAPADPCVRGPWLPPRRVQDRLAQRALARSARWASAPRSRASSATT